MMNYLVHGGESTERFDLLLSLTNIRSDDKVGALRDYYVKGQQESTILWVYDMDKSNFTKARKTMERVATIVELIKQHDWKGLVK